jgi:3-oxoacyl-[acyl-carrier protein] reductase
MGHSTEGECAVVVGAGAGIGRATCILLASRGWRVACLDRDREAVEETVAKIRAGMGIATAHVADVTDPASLDAAFAEAVAAYGQVHAVINTAGIQGQLGKPSHEVPLEDFDRVYAVNLRGALSVSQMALPHMLEHGYGRICHVASIAGKEGNPNMVSYSATKAGLIGMVKTQGKEYATSGITINALAPAVIRTPFLDSQPQQIIDYMTARIPIGRVGTVEEAAAMLAWMSSRECSFTTGFTFDLSGGRATY